MFWVGSLWRDGAPMRAPPSPPAHAAVVDSGWSNAVVAVLVAACALVGPLGLRVIDSRIVAAGNVTLDAVPAADGWRSRPGALTSWTPEIQSPSAFLRQTFVKDDRQVGLDVAYFRHQTSERKLVSSTNVLGGAGLHVGATWAIVGQHATTARIDARTFPASETTLVDPREERLLALHWYWIGDRMTANDFVAKLYTFLSRLTGRDEGAIVVVYARQSPTARRTLDEFLRDNGAALRDMLLKTAEAP
jgi:EpsI family protein